MHYVRVVAWSKDLEFLYKMILCNSCAYGLLIIHFLKYEILLKIGALRIWRCEFGDVMNVQHFRTLIVKRRRDLKRRMQIESEIVF